MNSKELRALQQPLKKEYKTDPRKAELLLHAEGKLGAGITCEVETDAGVAEAGLHPATGGDGSQACSGDMLLEALVACAGVTLKSVATAMDISIREGSVKAEGLLDFRGTLGVSREARSEERRVGKSVDIGGGGIMRKNIERTPGGRRERSFAPRTEYIQHRR